LTCARQYIAVQWHEMICYELSVDAPEKLAEKYAYRGLHCTLTNRG